MSFTFTIRARELTPLTFEEIRTMAGVDFDVLGETHRDGPLRGLFHLVLPGRSTRSVEVEVADDDASVRILTASSEEDHDLAIRVAGALARARTAPMVEPEDGEPLAVDELSQRYGRDWARAQVVSAAQAIQAVVSSNPGRQVSLAGPVRHFDIGQELLARLRDGPPSGFPARLIEALRASQWLPDHREASVLEVSRAEAGRPPARLAVLSPGERTLLPPVDAIIPWDPSGPMLRVRPGDLVSLFGGRARFIDERRILVEPIADAEWPAVLAAAARAGVELDDV